MHCKCCVEQRRSLEPGPAMPKGSPAILRRICHRHRLVVTQRIRRRRGQPSWLARQSVTRCLDPPRWLRDGYRARVSCDIANGSCLRMVYSWCFGATFTGEFQRNGNWRWNNRNHTPGALLEPRHRLIPAPFVCPNVADRQSRPEPSSL